MAGYRSHRCHTHLPDAKGEESPNTSGATTCEDARELGSNVSFPGFHSELSQLITFASIHWPRHQIDPCLPCVNFISNER
jgi:hypothetical protein